MEKRDNDISMISQIITFLKRHDFKIIDFSDCKVGIRIIDESENSVEQLKCKIKTKSFDVIAKNDKYNLMIKVLKNIDNFSKDKSVEMINFSKIFDCSPIIIGERNRNGILQENVLYKRYSIFSVSFKTFCNVVSHSQYPYIYSGRGGFFVNVKGEELKEIRKSFNFSLNDIAKHLDVTSKAVYEYESNNMNTRLTHLKTLAKLYDLKPDDFIKNISQAINIFQRIQEGYYIFLKELSKFQEEIDARLGELGFKTFWFKKAPLDMCFEEIDGDSDTNITLPKFSSDKNLFISRTSSVAATDEAAITKMIRKVEKQLQIHVEFLNRLKDLLKLPHNLVMVVDDNIFKEEEHVQGVPIIHKEEIPSEDPDKLKKMIFKRRKK
ncbi:MAG: helix-turn-helix domain-containing protein [Promethearchaeota archaeon]